MNDSRVIHVHVSVVEIRSVAGVRHNDNKGKMSNPLIPSTSNSLNGFQYRTHYHLGPDTTSRGTVVLDTNWDNEKTGSQYLLPGMTGVGEDLMSEVGKRNGQRIVIH